MEREIATYRTIKADHIELLDKLVNEAIQAGFQPYGNPTATRVNVDGLGSLKEEGRLRVFYTQAVVEYAPIKINVSRTGE